MVQEGIGKKEQGACILVSVQKELHLLLRERTNDPLVLPRYLTYNHNYSKLTSKKNLLVSQNECRLDDILPDGLHVDANNSKYFRHWTVLLYLDGCETLGATTFPLAVPEKNKNSGMENGIKCKSWHRDLLWKKICIIQERQMRRMVSWNWARSWIKQHLTWCDPNWNPLTVRFSEQEKVKNVM
jgi:hypothetical protein